MYLLFRSQTKREHMFLHFCSFQTSLLSQEIENQNFWTLICYFDIFFCLFVLDLPVGPKLNKFCSSV